MLKKFILRCQHSGQFLQILELSMKPGEHKTVQARILEYAEEIGWTFVSQEEAEQRRGFNPDVDLKNRAKGVSLFFDDLLDAKVR